MNRDVLTLLVGHIENCVRTFTSAFQDKMYVCVCAIYPYTKHGWRLHRVFFFFSEIENDVFFLLLLFIRFVVVRRRRERTAFTLFESIHFDFIYVCYSKMSIITNTNVPSDGLALTHQALRCDTFKIYFRAVFRHKLFTKKTRKTETELNEFHMNFYILLLVFLFVVVHSYSSSEKSDRNRNFRYLLMDFVRYVCMQVHSRAYRFDEFLCFFFSFLF